MENQRKLYENQFTLLHMEIIRSYVIPYKQQRSYPAVWCCETLLIYIEGKVYILVRTDD